jgi:hypothetical protein
MRNEKLLSDILMSVGVLPFLIVLVFLLFSAGFTGNDALGATFAAVIGYVLAYLLALIFGLRNIEANSGDEQVFVNSSTGGDSRHVFAGFFVGIYFCESFVCLN